MSLERTCYSFSQRTLTPSGIAACEPRWQFAFQTDRGPCPANRRLPSYCLVWYCRQSSNLDLKAILRLNGRATLDELVACNKAGCCEIELSEYAADDDLGDLPARIAKALPLARTRYETRTSAGQNDLTWLGQTALCRAIARAAGGVIEDPQLGTYSFVKRRDC